MSEHRGGEPRRLLACLSLANLLSLHVWLTIFRPAQETPLPGVVFAGAIGALLVLTALLWGLGFCVNRVPGIGWRCGLRLAGMTFTWAMIVWGALKPNVQQAMQYIMGVLSTVAVAGGSAIILLAAMAVLWQRAERAVRIMTTTALVVSPFAAINVAHAAWEVGRRGLSPVATDSVRVPTLALNEHRIRTVVLLFDEFDYELAFDATVRRDPLPALDGLRQRGMFATHAYPPMHSTAMSLPAMLTGRLVQEGKASNSRLGDLELSFDDGREGLWSTETTLFTDLRARGFTSLRMNDALFSQSRIDGPADADIVVPPAPGHLRTLGDHVAGHLVTVATLLPFFKRLALDARLSRAFGLLAPSVHVSRVADQIVELAGDARSDLLFLHILLPHLPVVFDSAAGNFGWATSADYRDNFRGVDQVVARVLTRLHERDRLGNTHLIVISDHFYRFKRASYGVGDHRIPFIAIFAGDDVPVGDFDKPFNTVLFRSMLGDIVTGEIRNSTALARWLETHATYGESPLTEYRKGW